MGQSVDLGILPAEEDFEEAKRHEEHDEAGGEDAGDNGDHGFFEV